MKERTLKKVLTLLLIFAMTVSMSSPLIQIGFAQGSEVETEAQAQETVKEESGTESEEASDNSTAGNESVKDDSNAVDETAEEAGSGQVSEDKIDSETTEAVSDADKEKDSDGKSDSDADGKTEEKAAEEAATDEAPVEEEALEETEEENFPAISEKVTTDGGVIVAIEAPEGAFPEGTEVVVKDVDFAKVIDAADKVLEGDAVDAKAVDISFVKDGKEIEPKDGKNISVSLQVKGLFKKVDGENHYAVHVKDDGTAELIDNADVTSKKAEFKADDFSVYAIVGSTDPDKYDRVRITFYNGGILSRQIVREGDVIDFPDPAPKESNKALYSWVVKDDEDATLANLSDSYATALTADDITALKALGGTTSVEGEYNVWDVRADVAWQNGYRIFFYEFAYGTADNVVCDTLTAEGNDDSGEGSVKIKNIRYIPQEGYRLDGWLLYDGSTTTSYHEGDTITVTEDTDLYPDLKQGAWVRLYTAEDSAPMNNIFAVDDGSGTKTIKYSDLEAAGEPTRKGYTFAGWYEDSEYTGSVVSGDISFTETTKTLYAKWEKSATTFNVSVWIEGPEGGPGEGTYTYYSGDSLEATTGDEISIEISDDGKTAKLKSGSKYVQKDGEDYSVSIDRYYLDSSESSKNTGTVTLSNNGTSSVNIYFDRDWWKLQYNLNSVTTEIGNYKWGQDVSDWSEYEDLFVYPWRLPHLNNTYNSLIKMMSMPYLRYQTYVSNLDPNPLPVGGTETFIVHQTTGSLYLEIWRELMTGETTEGKITRTLTVTEDDAEVTRTYVLAREASGIPGSAIYMDTEGLNGYHLHAAYGGGSSSTTNRLIQISDSTISSSLPISRSRQDMHQGDNVFGVTAFYKIKDDYSITFTNLGYDDIEAETGIKYSADLSEMDPGLTADNKKEGTYGQELSFAGWYTSQAAADNLDNTKRFTFTGATMPANNLVLYAGWTEPEFSVSFESNKGTDVAPIENLHAGDYITAPDNPTRTGYAFIGWYQDVSCSIPWDFSVNMITDSDVTLYAKWVEAVAAEIQYYDNEGTHIDGKDVKVYVGGTLRLLSAAEAGITTDNFMGWSTQRGNADRIVSTNYLVERNVNLYAISESSDDTGYTGGPKVMFMSNYPEKSDQKGHNKSLYTVNTQIINDQIVIRDFFVMANQYPTADGVTYTFAGWNTKADGTGYTYTSGDVMGVPEDSNLYAMWSETYEDGTDHLIYNANDGTGTTDPTAGYTFNKVKVADNGFTQEGYTFSGWNTKADGSGSKYAVGASYTLTPNDDILYAQWTANTFTVDGLDDVVYNGEEQKLEPVVRSGDTVLKKDTDYTLTYSDDTTNAGTVTVTVTGIGNYAEQSAVEVSYDITKAPLTITVDAPAAITYGDAAPALTGYTSSADGLQGSDAVADVGTVTYACDYAQYNDVGSYAVTASIADGDKGDKYSNYEITFVDSALTVEQKTVTIDWSKIDRTHNGEWQDINDPVIGGTVNGDTLTVGSYSAESVTSATDVGEYSVTITELSGDKAGNYKLPTGTTVNAADCVNGQWKINPRDITVKFTSDSNGSMTAITKEIKSGTALGQISEMTLPTDSSVTANAGYVFSGYWECSEGGYLKTSELADYLVTGKNAEVTFTAINNLKGKTSVIYYFNGGVSGSDTSQIWTDTAGKAFTATDLVTPTRTGYTLNAPTSWPEKYPEEGVTVVKAAWTANKYTIAFDKNNTSATGTTASVEDVSYDADAVLTSNGFTLEGYTFQGWATSTTGKVAYADGATVRNLSEGDADGDTVVTLYAVWKADKAEKYAITWDYDGGSVTSTNPASANVGDSVSFAVPTKDDAVFAGWTVTPDTLVVAADATSFTMPASDVTMKAKWTVGTHKVTFSAGEGSSKHGDFAEDATTEFTGIANGTKIGTATDPSKFTVPAITAADGYKFIGYECSKGGLYTTEDDYGAIADIVMGSEDITFTAIYTEKGKTAVIYDFAGGKSGDDTSQIWTGKAGTTFSHSDAKTPTRIGYTLTEPTNWPSAYPEEGATVVTATWTANSYTVKFNANKPSSASGSISGTMTDQTFTYDTAQALTENAYSLDGYAFRGWAETASGGVTYGDKAKVVNLATGETGDDEVNLYAVWTAGSYSISYDYAGGTVATANKTKAAAGETVTLTAPTKAGYTFGGWTATGGVTVTNNSFKMPSSDITVTADWTAKDNTVKFESQDGGQVTTDPATITVKSGQKVNVEPEVQADGTHYFTGYWACSEGGLYTKDEIRDYEISGKNNTVTFTAQISENNKTTVLYNFNGGKAEDATYQRWDGTAGATIDYGTILKPEKEGYTLTAPTDWPEKYPDAETRIQAVTATWTANSYKVVFHRNRNILDLQTEEEDGYTYDQEKSLKSLSDLGFSKTGNSFVGWALDRSGDVIYGDSALVRNLTADADGTVDLYAIWTPNTVIVNFVAGNKVHVKSTGSVGDVLEKPADPAAPEGYSFDGWYDGDTKLFEDGNEVFPVSNADYTAKFVPEKHKVTFAKGEYGDFAESDATKVFDDIETDALLSTKEGFKAPKIKPNAGYVFEGWKSSADEGVYAASSLSGLVMGTDDITFTAVYRLKDNTSIIFDFNGGTEAGNSYAQFTGTAGTAFEDDLPNPERAGYDGFDWDPEITDAGLTYPETADTPTTIKAVWTGHEIDYEVEYTVEVPDGAPGSTTVGDTPEKLTGKHIGDEITLADAPSINNGYTFSGWQATSADGSLIGIYDAGVAITMPASDVNLTAVFTAPGKVMIAFNPNGGEQKDASAELINLLKPGEKAEVPALKDRKGYTFKGWKSSNENYEDLGTNATETAVALKDESVIYTAQWEAKTYTISFNTNGGSKIDPITQAYGTEIKTPTPPTRDGYTFAGWEPLLPGVMPAENMTVKAKWVKTSTDPFKLRSNTQTKRSIRLVWDNVPGAERYAVYASLCNSKGKTYTPTFQYNTTSNDLNLKKVNGKKLKKGTCYKMYVLALDENGNILSKSWYIHIATKGGKYRNQTGVKVTNVKGSKITLSVGGTFKIKAKSQGKHLNHTHAKLLRYQSSNKNVATVASNGRITAVGKGSCKVCVYTINGKYKTIIVKVK